MSEFQGYYSLVQYSEYPERAEFINIGVVLIAGSSPVVLSKFSETPQRVNRAFKISIGKHYDNLCLSIKNRLKIEFSSWESKEALNKFINMRSGKIRMSPARSIYVVDGEKTLHSLFEDLVGETEKSIRPERANTVLRNVFVQNGVSQLLEKPNPVSLRGGIKVTAPFAYQNGSYNMIAAVSLNDNPDKALEKASPLMVEGEMLFEQTRAAEQKRLVLVGDVSQHDGDFVDMLSERMNRHHVKFHTINEISPLVQDIRANVSKN